MQSPPTSTRERDVYSVARLASAIRFALEGQLPMVWVEGEIASLARPASGHLYFTIKDAGAQLRCALFRQRGRLLRFRPENGQRVRMRVRVTVYEPRGDMQLIVEHMEQAGDGALMLAFEALKARLQAEGLFDPARKRALPETVRRIGIVSSPSGAVVHDIRSVLARRSPGIELVLYPVLVQGAEAPRQIVEALRLAAERDEVDLLLLARGGGSLEDLQAFNDEVVARAIAASPLPVVSAVGHEVDFTIADFVADLRAPTPSAAAELVSPDQREQAARLAALRERLGRQLAATLEHHRRSLAGLEQQLYRRHPGRRLEQAAQRLDECDLRLRRGVQRELGRREEAFAQLTARLQRTNPAPRLAQLATHRDELGERLQRAMRQRLDAAEQRLAHQAHALHAISPLATLTRGYAIVHNDEGEVVRRAASLTTGDRVTATLAEGRLHCTIDTIEETTP